MYTFSHTFVFIIADTMTHTSRASFDFDVDLDLDLDTDEDMLNPFFDPDLFNPLSPDPFAVDNFDHLHPMYLPAPSLPSHAEKMFDSPFTRRNFDRVPNLVSSTTMFQTLSWSKHREEFRHTTNGLHVYDFSAWRKKYNTTRFFVVDSQDPLKAKELSKVFQAAKNFNSIDTSYKKKQMNADHHMIPLMCCDAQRSALMWLPIDIPARSAHASEGFYEGQVLFADHMEPFGYESHNHPTTTYRNYLHGFDTKAICAELCGYYPSKTELARCRSKIEQVRLLSTRNPLTLADGCIILKKLAKADANSWMNVMNFLPFNEKCNWAQYLSSQTANSIYGVTYLPPTPFTGNNQPPIPFPPRNWEELCTKQVDERYRETATISLCLKNLRLRQPFQHLWHLKAQFDLSNFCSRHFIRSQGLIHICKEIQGQIIPSIETLCKRLSDMGITRVVLDGSHEQAHMAARHAVDHQNYMQAWRDLAGLCHLSMFGSEPTWEATQAYFTKFYKHASACRTRNRQPEHSVPMLHAQWSMNRNHLLMSILFRYTGKNLNDLLNTLHKGDCSLRYHFNHEDAHGRTTILNTVADQISFCVSVSMQRLHRKCVLSNYQEMACPSLSLSVSGGHACVDTQKCLGCDCPSSAKNETSDAVRNMFDHLHTYQERMNLDYSNQSFFPQILAASSTVQFQNHETRKRLHLSIKPVVDMRVNVDMRTLPGLEALVNGTASSNYAPPVCRMGGAW
jgi:hypothetical protein